MPRARKASDLKKTGLGGRRRYHKPLSILEIERVKAYILFIRKNAAQSQPSIKPPDNPQSIMCPGCFGGGCKRCNRSGFLPR